MVIGEGIDEAHACRSCPVGASHAGSAFVAMSRLFGAKLCPRCRFGATRIIGGRVCVNCYNREREMACGRNARGNEPTKLLEHPLHAVDYLVVIDGTPYRRRAERVTDLLEPTLRTLMTQKGTVAFAFCGRAPTVRQRDLFPPLGGHGHIHRRPRARRPAAYAPTVQGEFWPALAIAA